MERILTVQQMQDADKFTLERLGIEEQVLVERAGQAIAEEITKRFRGGRVLVCVGKGNNGADGLIVADILSKIHGYSVKVLRADTDGLELFKQRYDIILDALFGTGLNRFVEGKYKDVIDKINDNGSFIISCDIPSGLNGNSGLIMGVAVKANLTIGVQEYKIGYFLNDGVDCTGEIVVKDIGISVWEDNFLMRLRHKDIKRYFPDRQRNSHKGSFGKGAIIGGSKNYSGSVMLSLSALVALKMGIGYSNLLIPESLFDIYAGKYPECLITPLKDDGKNFLFDKDKLDKILDYDCIAIGMGAGVSKDVYVTIEYLLKNYSGNLVIDADGLNSLSKYGLDVLKEKKCNVLLTPHVGEFLRLSNCEKQEVFEHEIDVAKKFANEYGVTLLLKSAVSIITDGEHTFINTKGCSGMAKAGSGDVLSGVLCGLLSRNELLVDTVACACYLFGLSGEIAEKSLTAFTVTASDVINSINQAVLEAIN